MSRPEGISLLLVPFSDASFMDTEVQGLLITKAHIQEGLVTARSHGSPRSDDPAPLRSVALIRFLAVHHVLCAEGGGGWLGA